MQEPIFDRLLAWCSARLDAKAAMRERFGLLLRELIDRIDFPIIKVAGTNGKGSVSAMLSACLKADGKKAGLFTSPHLVSINERFRIDDADVPLTEVEAVAAELEDQLHRIVAEHGPAFTPSFFEVLALTALVLFQRQRVDIAIFEAGVGGANDSTSLLPAVVSVLTSVGFDHQKQLGNTLEAIAADKVGIAPAGSCLIVNRAIQPALKPVIRNAAAANGVRVLESRPFVTAFDVTLQQARARAEIDGKIYDLHPQLRGAYQQQNLDVVIEVLLFLSGRGLLADPAAVQGVAMTRWMARFEVLGSEPTWIIDSAHNPEAIIALIESLERVSEKSRRVLFFGNSEEKDFRTILGLIPAIADTVYFVDGFYKAIPQETLLAHYDPRAVANAGDGNIDRTIAAIREKHRDKIIVVAGSIFMIGEALGALRVLRL